MRSAASARPVASGFRPLDLEASLLSVRKALAGSRLNRSPPALSCTADRRCPHRRVEAPTPSPRRCAQPSASAVP